MQRHKSLFRIAVVYQDSLQDPTEGHLEINKPFLNAVSERIARTLRWLSLTRDTNRMAPSGRPPNCFRHDYRSVCAPEMKIARAAPRFERGGMTSSLSVPESLAIASGSFDFRGSRSAPHH